MEYYKIVYMLSGKYKSVYKARILLWENGRIKIRDEDAKEHILKEEHIRSIVKVKGTMKKNTVNQNNTATQQELF